MKVDKAVSTNNDIADGGGPTTDLHNGTLHYESILNRLVERKILAIKRDCEQTERKLKQQRKRNCLGGLLFGKRRHQPEHNETIIDNSINTKIIESTSHPTSVHRMNECAAVADTMATATNGTVISPNRNKLIECSNRRQSIDANAKPNEQCPEDCVGGISSTIASSHAAVVQIDEVTKSPSPSHLHSISEVLRPARKISTDTVVSLPSTSKHTTFSAPTPIGGGGSGDGAVTSIDQEQRRRLRVLEAKSISAQCSPIFPRQSFGGDAAIALSPITKLKSSIPQRLMSRQNTSDDSVNVTFSSVLVNEDAIDSGDTTSDMALATVNRKLSQRKMDTNKLGRSSVANDVHGFIPTFNQMTTSSPTVIAGSKLRSAGGTVLHPMSIIDSARAPNPNQIVENATLDKAMVSRRSSDEEEPPKNDKRKNRKLNSFV